MKTFITYPVDKQETSRYDETGYKFHKQYFNYGVDIAVPCIVF